MRRITAFLLGFILTAGAATGPATLAQSLPPNSPGATPPVDRLAPRTMVVTGGVTVHAEPTSTSAAIGSLKPGQRVEVLNGNGESGWYRLAQGGYAIMDHLQPAETGSTGPSNKAYLIKIPAPGRWLERVADRRHAQLAQRIGVRQPRVAELERNEAGGQILLSTLERAARTMGCTLVYAFVPTKTLDELVHERAVAIAADELQRVHDTMVLEMQGTSPAAFQQQVEARAQQLLREQPRRIWAEQDDGFAWA